MANEVVRYVDGAVEGNQELKILNTNSDGMKAFREPVILPHAFFANSSLETVIIGRNISYLGEGAFSNCTKLQTFVVEASFQRYISKYCAAGCVQLKNLIIAEGTEEIGERAFYGCSALEAVVIPESMRKIGKEAFFMCSNLQTVVSFSNKTDDFQQAFQQKVEFRRSDDPIVSSGGWIGRIIDEVTIESHTIHGWKNIFLTGYEGKESLESLEIPASFNGIPVLQWDPNSLYRYKDLKTIIWKSHYVYDYVCMSAFPKWTQEIKFPQFKILYGYPQDKICFIPMPPRILKVIITKYHRTNPKSHNKPKSMLKTLWFPEGLLEIDYATYEYSYENLKRLEFPASLERIKHRGIWQ